MAEPLESRELKAPEDGLVAAVTADDDGSAPLDESAAEKQQIRKVDDDRHVEVTRGNGLAKTKSYATETSVSTATEAEAQGPRTWRGWVNPLRWGRIPEVPRERIVSMEYRASFLSRMTFEWMTPLMTVSLSVVLSTLLPR